LHAKIKELKNQGDYFKKIQNNLENTANFQRKELDQIKKDFDERSKWAVQLDKELQDKNTLISNLKSEFRFVDIC